MESEQLTGVHTDGSQDVLSPVLRYIWDVQVGVMFLKLTEMADSR